MEFWPCFLFISLYVESRVLNGHICIGVMYIRFLPSLASSSIISLPYMFECALTLYINSGCNLYRSCVTISIKIALFGWLLCNEEYFICILIESIEFRLSINMCEGLWRHIELLNIMISNMIVSLALSIFCKPANLFDILKSL